MAASTITQSASIRPTFTPATYVMVDPTPTEDKNLSGINNTVIMIVGGLTLLLIGLCCAAVTLFRYFRHERPTVRLVDHEKALVLKQSTIDSSFPIRIYPSTQQFFVDGDDMVVAIKTPPDDHLESTSDHELVKTKDVLPVREKLSHQLPQQHTFMSFTLMNKLWSRDSSHVAPGQLHTNKDILNATPRDEPMEDLCSICLDEYVVDDQLRILPCGHEYHIECIDIWLIHSSTQCPLCKHDLLSEMSPTPA